MNKYVDSHRHDVTYAEGNLSYVKLRPHRQRSVACRINPKLSPHYFDPYQVISCSGEVAYKLQLHPFPIFTRFFMFCNLHVL